MRRRHFLNVLGAAAIWPSVAWAQRQAAPVVGLLAPGSANDSKRFYDGFFSGMKEKGYEIGRSYVLEARYAEGDLSRLPALAEELAKLKPQVLVSGTEAGALAAKKAIPDTPIVGINMVDPLRNGLIKSVSRPGGNVTGTLQYIEGLTEKQLELTRDMIANASTLGILANTGNLISAGLRREADATAKKLVLQLVVVEVQTPDELAPAFQEFARQRANVVVIFRDAMFMARRRQIASFALAARLPTIFGFREHVESGGLKSYGIDLGDNYRRAAYYVDRILKGDKPADLPIEFPTKLELVINSTTAKAIGLSIPATLLARADEVID
jgi:putative ABC transport system substrate-binding protein